MKKLGDCKREPISMASYASEKVKNIMLNVRDWLQPPWDRAKNGWMDLNPGMCLRLISFGLKPGDDVVDFWVPYGEFFINESESEMLYVVVGAVWPPCVLIYIHLFKSLKTKSKK